MYRVSAGYTIIEVIIFLGISGALLIASMTFLYGSEGHNRFSQSMRDTQSKIQDWLNDIPTGYAGGTRESTGLTCQKVANQPKFGTGSGNTNECIFLGKALQITNAVQESQIYAYSVFGLRTFTPASGDERLVSNLYEAHPVPAVNKAPYGSGGPGSVDLTESYTIPGGAKVKKILKSSGVAGDNSHLAGFYLSFNPMQTSTSGSASLVAYQYDFSEDSLPGNASGAGSKDVDDCINLQTSGSFDCGVTAAAPNPQPLTDWEICFGNDSNDDTAVITISSVGGLNVSTKLEFKSCP